jgi:hypothetical protein
LRVRLSLDGSERPVYSEELDWQAETAARKRKAFLKETVGMAGAWLQA